MNVDFGLDSEGLNAGMLRFFGYRRKNRYRCRCDSMMALGLEMVTPQSKIPSSPRAMTMEPPDISRQQRRMELR